MEYRRLFAIAPRFALALIMAVGVLSAAGFELETRFSAGAAGARLAKNAQYTVLPDGNVQVLPASGGFNYSPLWRFGLAIMPGVRVSRFALRGGPEILAFRQFGENSVVRMVNSQGVELFSSRLKATGVRLGWRVEGEIGLLPYLALVPGFKTGSFDLVLKGGVNPQNVSGAASAFDSSEHLKVSRGRQNVPYVGAKFGGKYGAIVLVGKAYHKFKPLDYNSLPIFLERKNPWEVEVGFFANFGWGGH